MCSPIKYLPSVHGILIICLIYDNLKLKAICQICGFHHTQYFWILARPDPPREDKNLSPHSNHHTQRRRPSAERKKKSAIDLTGEKARRSELPIIQAD